MSDLIRPSFFKMDNVIQNYPWGSMTSLQNIFGIANPSSLHQAEIWMGAHPNGCSKITVDGKKVLLSDFIATDPNAILGPDTQARFGELPYLFKVLAAEKALSVQVHPSKEQAEVGFAKEVGEKIPLDSSHRNYKDSNHKPELVYALTPYQAMNGFREIKDIVEKFKAIDIEVLTSLTNVFSENQNSQGLQIFFQSILSLDGEVKSLAINELVSYAHENKENNLFSLIIDLSAHYPGDIGLFAPLMLNVLTLQPGEAMYLDASTPHAYIKGTALEVMASSDNVLRAGLTPKYIDVPELVANTLFKTKPKIELLLPPEQKESHLHYPIPVSDFKFSVYHQVNDVVMNVNSAEIIFAIDSSLTVTNQSGKKVTICKGESLFIPAYVQNYSVVCNGSFTKAFS